MIKKDEAICLYGAGELGTRIFEWLRRTGYCRLVAWVDAAYKDKPADVTDPMSLLDKDFEHVLVAVENDGTFASIVGDILKYKLAPVEKIIGPILNVYKFCERYVQQDII